MSGKRDIQQDAALAMHGDAEAFGRLIRVYQRDLYSLARTYLKRDEDCADAIQETIFKSFKAIRSLREPAYFKTWLSRILIHECIQLLRSQQRLRIDSRSEWNYKIARLPYEAIELNEAVAQLEDELRAVIQLHYYMDVPVKRIAIQLGVAEGTVKSRLHRARKLLAEVLESPYDRRMIYDPTVTQERRRNDSISLHSVVVRERIDVALSCLPSKRQTEVSAHHVYCG